MARQLYAGVLHLGGDFCNINPAAKLIIRLVTNGPYVPNLEPVSS